MNPRFNVSLVVVVGMTGEARLARPLGRVVVGAAALSKAVLEGADGVLSFGLCGGLDPALTPGDLVIGARVDGCGFGLAADADWLARLSRGFPGAARGPIAGSATIVGSAGAKAELRGATGAIATDMESHAVAAAARDAGVPFAILRAVSDGAMETLPLCAEAGFRRDGTTDLAAVIRGLIARPAELPGLIRTGRSAAKGFAALRRAVAAWPREGEV